MWWVRFAYPPYNLEMRRYVVGALRILTLQPGMRRYAVGALRTLRITG